MVEMVLRYRSLFPGIEPRFVDLLRGMNLQP
jgi:hypothetical protein